MLLLEKDRPDVDIVHFANLTKYEKDSFKKRQLPVKNEKTRTMSIDNNDAASAAKLKLVGSSSEE